MFNSFNTQERSKIRNELINRRAATDMEIRSLSDILNEKLQTILALRNRLPEYTTMAKEAINVEVRADYENLAAKMQDDLDRLEQDIVDGNAKLEVLRKKSKELFQDIKNLQG